MLGTIVLSLDSLFAGAALRFFGLSKRHWPLAWRAVGLADLVALLMGRGMSVVIRTPMTSFQQVSLFAGCALVAIFLGRLCSERPRVVILGMAVLFSIDNLLAGAQFASLLSGALVAVTAGILSCVACVSGLHVAAAIAVHVRPRVSFGLASAAVVTAFLVF
jgi:hypothetical protein